MPSDSRFAVLIDADNVSVRYIKLILDEISKDGVATYKRIYGDWTNPALVSWKSALLDNSVLPIQQYSYTSGKNSTDSAMIIDAMDILYSGQVEGFCLVSSDSDFTRLAARLRESGMTVIGMGESKTPNSFIAACNKFKYLDILSAADEEEPEEPVKPEQAKRPQPKKAARKTPAKPAKPELPKEEDPEEPKTSLRTIRRALRSIVRENSDEEDWIFIGKVGNILGKRYPDFDVRNFGFSKLTPFLDSLDMFEIKSQRRGWAAAAILNNLKVRDAYAGYYGSDPVLRQRHPAGHQLCAGIRRGFGLRPGRLCGKAPGRGPGSLCQPAGVPGVHSGGACGAVSFWLCGSKTGCGDAGTGALL